MDKFAPNFNGTLLMSANATSQNVALPLGGGLFLRVHNAGANIAYIETSADANGIAMVPTANAGGGIPVFANIPQDIMMKAGDTRIAAISAGNSTLYFTRGNSY